VITDLFIEGYQSLRDDTRLRLGAFTVILGPTGSGKSSVFRAAQLAAFNARGTAYISRGASKAIAGLGCQDEGWAVTITRGGRGADSYRIAVIGPDGGEPKTWDYTKLAGKVPPEVTELLNLREINFASQFDHPYLLCETAGDVAKTLGQLTQVTLIFNAAREAGRRKKALAADLAAAERERDRLAAEAQRFITLRQRMDAAQAAEEALGRLAGHMEKADRLHGHLVLLSAAQDNLGNIVLLPEPPDLSGLQAQAARIARLQALMDEHQNASMNLGRSADEIASAAIAAGSAEHEIHKLLEAEGICPLCKQVIGGES